MSALPLVSIVIPAYNHELYVEQSLLSAINQTYPNIEIIVIDDGSTDNTARLIEKTLNENQSNRNVIFIQQINQGLSKTLNKAVSIAQGEYIQFLASDDAYLPDKTYRSIRPLLNTTDKVAGVYCDGYLMNDKGQKLMRFSDKYVKPISNNTYREMLVGNWIPALGVLYRKNAILAAGGFNEEVKVEDYDLFLRLFRKFDIISIPDKLFMYRWHDSNFSKNIDSMNKQLSLIRLKNPDLQSFYNFIAAIKTRRLGSLVGHFTLQNFDLLRRLVLRKIQLKYSLQNVSHIDLFWLLVKKAYALITARARATLFLLKGLRIGGRAKLFGAIRNTGNIANISIGNRAVLLGDITFITPYSKTANLVLIGDDVVIDRDATLFSMGGGIEIGNGCYIGPNVIIQANGDVKIGDFSMIASNCAVYANNHVTRLDGTPFWRQGNVFEGIIIGSNCWIGNGVTILDGSVLGNNSVVAAGCVIKGDHPCDTVIGAKAVKGNVIRKL